MPSTFEREHRRELLILDTGPIRELVLFHAVDQFGFEGLRSNLQCIVDRDSYIRCTKFIRLFHKKTTSASVVAELNYWIRETDRTGQERLWKRVYEEFREMGMDEQVVKLLEMDISLVTRLGPMDVSLLEIARRNGNLSPLVLTVDRDLHDECARAGFRVQHLKELALTEQDYGAE
ncbi:MAG: hypothetical protein ABSF45_18060 [Terriglobia bacterium]|jgi:rRNA-processing protein FCF1